MTTLQTVLHHGLLIVGTLLILLGTYPVMTAPVGHWYYRRRARRTLRHLIRHHEQATRGAA